MPKLISPNPKRVVVQKTFDKVASLFRRQMAELARSAVSPSAAQRDATKAIATIETSLKNILAVTNLPVVGVDEDTPAGAHWLVVPMGSPRNAMYARLPLVCAVMFVDKDGTCPIGAIMDPTYDVCALAEAGLGMMAPDRLRCATRIDLDGTLAMLPWKTVDVVETDLLKTLENAGVHTRKSGCTLSDIVDVAAGRADMAIATRLTRAEALLANLMMAECGGFASDLAGKPLGPASTGMVIANPKLHGKVVSLLKA